MLASALSTPDDSQFSPTDPLCAGKPASPPEPPLASAELRRIATPPDISYRGAELTVDGATGQRPGDSIVSGGAAPPHQRRYGRQVARCRVT